MPPSKLGAANERDQPGLFTRWLAGAAGAQLLGCAEQLPQLEVVRLICHAFGCAAVIDRVAEWFRRPVPAGN